MIISAGPTLAISGVGLLFSLASGSSVSASSGAPPLFWTTAEITQLGVDSHTFLVLLLVLGNWLRKDQKMCNLELIDE